MKTKKIISSVLFWLCILCAFAPVMSAQTLGEGKGLVSVSASEFLIHTPFGMLVLLSPVVIVIIKRIKLALNIKNVMFITLGIVFLFAFNQCAITTHGYLRTINTYSVQTGFGLFAYPVASLLYLVWSFVTTNYTTEQIFKAVGIAYT